MIGRMNVSPTTVHHYRDHPNLLGVILQLFSILGGLFMVAKFIDTYVSCCWTPKKRTFDDDDMLPIN
jgi:hypothetical protein